MTELAHDEVLDRLVLRLEAGGPIEVGDLTSSFAALARIYERHYRPTGEPAPKLYVTKLETGSIIAEIAPYVVLLGSMVTAMDTAVIVSEFTNRLTRGLKAFSDPSGASGSPALQPSRDDAADLREFVRPLAGKKGASLGIKHARYIREEGDRRTIAEYVFDETEINRATINIEDSLANSVPLLLEGPEAQAETVGILQEVPLIFEQASRKPGKEKGRTGDRGIIAHVSQKALPVYFKNSINSLKEQMVKGDVNPLTDRAFVVDVHVIRMDGEPKGYIVTAVHAVLPLDEAAE